MALAAIALASATGWAAEPCPEATVQVDEAVWSPDGLTASHVVATTCCGERPAWTLSARDAELDGDELTLRRVTARVYGVPVAWTPWARLELGGTRRYVGVPRVGRGLHGWQVAVPFVEEGPSHRLLLAPEIRQGGVVRGLAEVRASGLELDAAVGPSGRGAVEGQAAQTLQVAGRPVELAWGGTWTSDAAYLGEFGDSWLSRDQAWTRSAFVARSPGLGLEGVAFQGDAAQVVIGVPVRWELGPGHVAGRLDLLDETTRGQVELGVGHGASVGPLELRGDAGLRGFGHGGGLTSDAVASGRVGLPFWAEGRSVWQWDPAVVAGVGARLAEGPTLSTVDPFLASDPALDWRSRGFLDDQAPERVWAGPSLGVSRGPVSARIDAPWTTQGPVLGARAAAHGRWLDGAVQGAWREDDWLVSTRVSAAVGRGRVRLGTVDAPDLHQWRAGAERSLTVGELRVVPGGQAVWSPAGLDEVAGRLTVESACGCLGIDTELVWSTDRELLSGGVSVRVR